MKKIIYLPFIIFGLITYSCDKDNSESTAPTQNSCITIFGYTAKDNLNQSTGVSDTTDWRLDDNWSQCEQNIFGGSNFNTNCIFDDSYLTNPSCFPNPTTDYFSFDIGVHTIPPDTNVVKHDSLIRMDLLFLNQRNEKIGVVHTNKKDINSTVFSLQQMDSLPGDTIFRVYYLLTDSNSCIRMGHGDIIRR